MSRLSYLVKFAQSALNGKAPAIGADLGAGTEPLAEGREVGALRQKTSSQIDNAVLEKVARVYYRGMSDIDVDKVMREGIPEWSSLAAEVPNARAIAEEYATRGPAAMMQPVRNRSLHGKTPTFKRHMGLLSKLRAVPYLESVEDLEHLHPQLVPLPLRGRPEGAVLKIDIPDDLADLYAPEGGTMPGEYKTKKVIPPKYITPVKRGVPMEEMADPLVASHMRRLTPKDMRLLKKVMREPALAAEAYQVATSVNPLDPALKGADWSTRAEMKAVSRQIRKQRTKLFKSLLARGRG